MNILPLSMSNWTKFLLLVACMIALLLIGSPIYFYVKDFHQFPRSTNPSDWGTFGDFFGGILNPIISFLTLIVTIFIAVYINKIERRNHEETVNTPVKPLFTIKTGDFFSSDVSLIGRTLNEDFYDYIPPQAPTRPHDYFEKQFYLKVSNKGLGIANGVSVTFEIDLNKLKSRIVIDEPKLKITTTDIMFDEDGRSFIVLHIKSDYFNYQGSIKILAIEKTGLGVIDKAEEVKVYIPTQIMSAFQYFNVIRRLRYENIEFPTFFIIFEYKNIHDKVLTTKFKVGLYHIHNYHNYSLFRILQEQVN